MGRGKWLTLGKEESTWETGGSGRLCRLTIKWTSSKTVFKDFPNTLRVPSTACFNLLHNTKNAHFWISLQNFSWRISFLKMQKNLWKVVAACNLFKNATLPHVFFYHILRTVPKDFRSKVLLVHFNKSFCAIQIHTCFYTPNERWRYSTQ